MIPTEGAGIEGVDLLEREHLCGEELAAETVLGDAVATPSRADMTALEPPDEKIASAG